MKLLVGSFYSASTRNSFWHKLKIEYLKHTTKNFDHFVIITKDVDYTIFDQKILKILPSKDIELKIHNQAKSFSQQLEACNFFLEYYRKKEEYDSLLLLDNTSFPITNNWQEKLEEEMEDKSYAAPLKTENFDNFPNCSNFFLKSKDNPLWNWNFTPDKWIRDLSGKMCLEIGSCIDSKYHFYPLLRSNIYNPHPILAGVYHDLFYHHGSNDNEISYRSIDINNYFKDKFLDHKKIEQELFQYLSKDPQGFIDHLKNGNL